MGGIPVVRKSTRDEEYRHRTNHTCRYCALVLSQVADNRGEEGPANGQHNLGIDDGSIRHLRWVLHLHNALSSRFPCSKYRI